MLTITGLQLTKLLTDRYNEKMVMHPNYHEASDLYGFKYSSENDLRDVELDDISKYTNAVLQTIITYFHTHVSTTGKLYYLSFNQDGSANVQPKHSSKWQDIICECANVALDMLSDIPELVLSSCIWSVHLAHLAGAEGIVFHKAKQGNLTGSMLIDHGRWFGIDYKLIDSISNGSLDSVYPTVINYF